MAEIRQVFVEDWPTPVEWQAKLEQVVPRKGELSYLQLVWEPGDRWDPAQRWMLYQMWPLSDDHMLKSMLDGPNPRNFGYYDRVKKRYVRKRNAPLISLRQWLLYRQTGRLAVPYWVIQGNAGGHRWEFTETEKKIIAHRTGVTQVSPPVIGSLPYAPFDNRVLDKLANLDRIRQDEFAVSFAYRHPEMFEAEEERMLAQAERDLWKWIETQVDDTLRNVPYGFVSRMAGYDPVPRIFVPR